jgi:hypothetical protein
VLAKIDYITLGTSKSSRALRLDQLNNLIIVEVPEVMFGGSLVAGPMLLDHVAYKAIFGPGKLFPVTPLNTWSNFSEVVVCHGLLCNPTPTKWEVCLCRAQELRSDDGAVTVTVVVAAVFDPTFVLLLLSLLFCLLLLYVCM